MVFKLFSYLDKLPRSPQSDFLFKLRIETIATAHRLRNLHSIVAVGDRKNYNSLCYDQSTVNPATR